MKDSNKNNNNYHIKRDILKRQKRRGCCVQQVIWLTSPNPCLLSRYSTCAGPASGRRVLIHLVTVTRQDSIHPLHTSLSTPTQASANMATTNTPDMASAASSDTFALQVLSHSVGVNGVLSFPGLPFTTTVAQLKTKIKDQVAQPNAGERHQRLIHRGRILLKGEETMIDLFGEQTVSHLYTASFTSQC